MKQDHSGPGGNFLVERPRSPAATSGVADAARNERASGMTAGSRSVDRIVGCFILVKGFDSRVDILPPILS